MPNQKFDLSFCPEMYWDAQVCFLANVTGTIRRRLLELAIADENAPAAVFEIYSDKDKAWQILPALGFQYPAARSGEDLKPLRPNETEIARVWTPGTIHAEVTSVRALRNRNRILYSVTDEYWDSGSDYRIRRKSSSRPLTMGELINLMDTAEWGERDQCADGKGLVLPWWEQAWESQPDVDYVRQYVAVQSYFYPQLKDWYLAEFENWAATRVWPYSEVTARQ